MPSREIKYKVVKRKIKYPRLELKTGGLVVVIPRDGDFDVPEFIFKHKDWINNKQSLIKKFSRVKISLRDQALTKEGLRDLIFNLIDQYGKVIKIKPKRIIIKNMKSKWGSCSSNKNLCFNLSLSRLPDRMIQYVIYHEMCHLINRKHDDSFKLLLKKRYKNPSQFESKLFSYWFALNKNSN